MEYKDAKTLNELKQIFEQFEKRNEETMKKRIFKAVLSQTTVFFTSLVILLGLWTAGFGIVINLLIKSNSTMMSLKEELIHIRIE